MRVFDPELNQKVGKRVRECRKKANMTQKSLAAKINITSQHLYNIESGKRTLTVDIAKAMGDVLNVWDRYLLCKSNYRTTDEMLTSLQREKEQRDERTAAIQVVMDENIKEGVQTFISFINAVQKNSVRIEQQNDKYIIHTLKTGWEILEWERLHNSGASTIELAEWDDEYHPVTSEIWEKYEDEEAKLIISESVLQRMIYSASNPVSIIIKSLCDYKSNS